jgi:hypothetical protein
MRWVILGGGIVAVLLLQFVLAKAGEPRALWLWRDILQAV